LGKLIILLFIIGVLCLAAAFAINTPPQKFTGSGNFSCDLEGPTDTRPSTWGTADVCLKTITFNRPVTILAVRGDLIGWARKPTTAMAGALVGLQDSGPEGSTHADWLADNTFLYYQMPIQQSGRLAFNDQIHRTLSDGKLKIKIASFLNETGQSIHLEGTFTVVYEY
jgi:hypothetical protein